MAEDWWSHVSVYKKCNTFIAKRTWKTPIYAMKNNFKLWMSSFMGYMVSVGPYIGQRDTWKIIFGFSLRTYMPIIGFLSILDSQQSLNCIILSSTLPQLLGQTASTPHEIPLPKKSSCSLNWWRITCLFWSNFADVSRMKLSSWCSFPIYFHYFVNFSCSWHKKGWINVWHWFRTGEYPR